VGGGIAGYGAAMAAVQEGLRVTVFNAGYGMSALVGGLWLGPTPHVNEQQNHDQYVAALDLYSPPGTNGLIATDRGTLQKAEMFQSALLNLNSIRTGRIAVCALSPLTHDSSLFIAECLNRQCRELGKALTFVSLPVDLEEQTWQGQGPADLARAFNAPSAVAFFAEQLQSLLTESIQGILLPPVLGIDGGVRTLIENKLEVPVGELSSPLSATQGLRLVAAISKALLRENVKCVGESVTRIQVSDNVVTAYGSQQAVQSGALVLATGGFFSGGLVQKGEHVYEAITGTRAEEQAQAFGEYRVIESSWYARMGVLGVSVDAQKRLLDATGKPLSSRVFAAGTLLRELNAASSQSGLGHALLSGHAAGRAAARTFKSTT